jgi:hypothetical protein
MVHVQIMFTEDSEISENMYLGMYPGYVNTSITFGDVATAEYAGVYCG